jgi:hypothetical protein
MCIGTIILKMRRKQEVIVECQFRGGNNEPFVNTSFIYQHLDGILQTAVHSQLKDISEMVHFSDC